jgi:hypothetical protein
MFSSDAKEKESMAGKMILNYLRKYKTAWYNLEQENNSSRGTNGGTNSL